MTTESSHESSEAAQRSYELRVRRLERARQKSMTADAALHQLFDLTFKHPDKARAKFAEMVNRNGLSGAIRQMDSKPTDNVPAWKALRGDHTIVHGETREREQARENLLTLEAHYRAAESAELEHRLATTLLTAAEAELNGKQENTPVAMPAPRKTRKLRQRL